MTAFFVVLTIIFVKMQYIIVIRLCQEGERKTVAEKFSGNKGKYVSLSDTVRGFAAIVDGEMDEYPESAFYNVGTIDDALEKAKAMGGGMA